MSLPFVSTSVNGKRSYLRDRPCMRYLDVVMTGQNEWHRFNRWTFESQLIGQSVAIIVISFYSVDHTIEAYELEYHSID